MDGGKGDCCSIRLVGGLKVRGRGQDDGLGRGMGEEFEELGCVRKCCSRNI